MKLSSWSILIAALLIISSCNSGQQQQATEEETDAEEKSLVGYVDLNDPLEEDLIAQGADIFRDKCSRCHTLDTTEFFVPSFAGITNRRSPEWIMNMILNVDLMLEVDSVAHQLKKETQIKMPDRRLSVDQARAVLEYMRKNDLEQTGTKDQGAK
jgi:mono/diheme cytochrome c family protein